MYSRKSLNFDYNYLNLLEKAGVADYSYSTDGVKLSVRDDSGNGFTYLGSLILSANSTEFQFSDGVINKTTGGYNVNYFLRDHLGSVRSVVDKDKNVIQQSDYYPFGLKQERSDYVNNSNRFLYNGKESQTTGNIGVLDYGWRMSDPEIARWFVLDPLAERNNHHSPYVFSANNPLRFVDPDGRDWYEVLDANGKGTGKFEYFKGSKDREGYRNAGATYSAKNADGTYTNYYQNASFKSKKKVNVESVVLNNANWVGQLLGSKSSLSNDEKKNLLTSAMHNSQKEFGKNAVKYGLQSTEMVGTGISVAGYGVAATGLGAGIGLAMVNLGGGIAGVSGALNAAIGAYEKDPSKGVVSAALTGVNAGIGYFIGTSKATDAAKLVANGIFDAKYGFMQFIVNNSNNKSKKSQ